MRLRSRYPALLWALGLIALPMSVPAGAGPAAPDWPSTPDAATSGSFSVAQISTADPAQLLAEWSRPASPRLRGTNEIRRNQAITTFVFFRGCRPDPTGKCHVTAKFELRSPAGKVDRYPPMVVWAQPPLPTPGIIMLSPQSVGLTFKAGDAVGTYTLVATVTDQVAGVTVHTRRPIVVSA